jgi:butyrate kinase
LIIAHIGGGITIGAHRRGLLVDMSDAVKGDGPMAPTRCGSLPVVEVFNLCFSGKQDEATIRNYAQKTGGLCDHLGTSDVLEIMEKIDAGDKYAKLVFDGMIYQIAKTIAAMAVVLKGQVDGIVLTGGISRSTYLVDELSSYCSWICDVCAMPGEFEMEAMASGVIRALTGEEEVRQYTGQAPWKGFDN